tara:strand:- start:1355 stop:2047 length:693 start_codon:yes stop_codon:yes gene_type:complete
MSESKIDYLDEDEPLRNQNYVCISFLNPEDVLKNKESYYFSKFIEKCSKDISNLLDNLIIKYPDDKNIIDGIKDNHKYLFNSDDMNDQLTFFKNTNSDSLEKDFHNENNFKTSVRGIKVRGVYDTIEQAKTRCENLKKKDSYFNIYVAQVGCWLPYESHIATNVDNQEYSETELNTLMKHYKENKDNKDIVFDNRRTDAIKSIKDEETVENITDTLKNQEDPWLSAKGLS